MLDDKKYIKDKLDALYKAIHDMYNYTYSVSEHAEGIRDNHQDEGACDKYIIEVRKIKGDAKQVQQRMLEDINKLKGKLGIK